MCHGNSSRGTRPLTRINRSGRLRGTVEIGEAHGHERCVPELMVRRAWRRCDRRGDHGGGNARVSRLLAGSERPPPQVLKFGCTATFMMCSAGIGAANGKLDLSTAYVCLRPNCRPKPSPTLPRTGERNTVRKSDGATEVRPFPHVEVWSQVAIQNLTDVRWATRSRALRAAVRLPPR